MSRMTGLNLRLRPYNNSHKKGHFSNKSASGIHWATGALVGTPDLVNFSRVPGEHSLISYYDRDIVLVILMCSIYAEINYSSKLILFNLVSSPPSPPPSFVLAPIFRNMVTIQQVNIVDLDLGLLHPKDAPELLRCSLATPIRRGLPILYMTEMESDLPQLELEHGLTSVHSGSVGSTWSRSYICLQEIHQS